MSEPRPRRDGVVPTQAPSFEVLTASRARRHVPTPVMGRRELRTGDPAEDAELFEFGSRLPYVARVRITINGLDYGTTSGLFEYYDDDLPHGHYITVDSCAALPAGHLLPRRSEHELHALCSGDLPAAPSAKVVCGLSHRRAVPGPRHAVVPKMSRGFRVCDVGDQRSYYSLPGGPLLSGGRHNHQSKDLRQRHAVAPRQRDWCCGSLPSDGGLGFGTTSVESL